MDQSTAFDTASVAAGKGDLEFPAAVAAARCSDSGSSRNRER